MRIALITESFPPDVNGVANSVVRVAEHLVARGHQPMVIAPAPSSSARGVTGARDYPVVRIPSVPLPRYRGFRFGMPSARLTDALIAHAPDVVHLASPFFLGARGVALANQRNLPTVAVYQTDVAAFLRNYRLAWGEDITWHWLRTIHNGADRTLAPSSTAAGDLAAQGIHRVHRWGRGVDTARFDPGKRSAAVRRALAPNGEMLIGYVGRLAAEKRLDLLAPAARLPGVRLVVVGDGPGRKEAEKALPGAAFLGQRGGDQLARIYASLDVFVHAGPHETFCQSVQEAMASGIPVVAPAAGGPLDLVRAGLTGTLVPPGDGHAIADAVAELIAEPELRQRYGLAARDAVAGRTWAAIGDELIAHYAAVLRGRAVRPRLAVAA
ncbi:phosphatidylinositol alpha 1,6-mannosyltransferase [Asanoa ferruginea]|uniref:Phosphatidylinositol alpha 1,6-mannosyltransferase n=1 Tax=Asanoa ferruginea TaxID=53367 RepID=A0A3D9ZEF3_9ACTN|nr:glycosyltransferase family 1 protein [Asanoa ferruginea]REF94842.1 phosphatidylinositol alpha 1,6-mannosyltransferase [Asanoa ferruginea]